MIDLLVRTNMRKLMPYTCARSLYQEGILLDANENPYGSPVQSYGQILNRYPDPYARTLREKIAAYAGASAENIFVGVGSDEIIDLLMRTFIESDKNILIFEPTYGMYRVAAEINGIGIVTCLLNENFQIDLNLFQETVTHKTKMIMCCSPNSPTGNLLNTKDIVKLCATFSGIVVVDEAYIEFASRDSLTPFVLEYENLVILRTFSKAWGLAGARVGYAVASPAVVDYLNKIKAPYNVNRISADIATRALNECAWLLETVKKTRRERTRMTKELQKRGCIVFPSETNFLLVRIREAKNVSGKLAMQGIIIRDFSDRPLLSDCVRISLGTQQENDRFLEAITPLL